MATLAFGLIGAGLGSMIGQPALGWTLGAAVGGALFPETNKLADAHGPRLGDSKVQVSTYGTAIGRTYGTIRKAGCVIWSTPIIEHATTETVESGGKGGGGGQEQDQTTYSYTASFAVAIREFEMHAIRKIWANGELIYNLGVGAIGGTLIGSVALPMTVYLGSETQTPDPLMESFLGSGNVPAYRGVSYVVFNDLALAPFGNRLPNLEFEVVEFGDTAPPVETSIYAPAPVRVAAALLAPNGILWYAEYGTGFGYSVLHAYDLNAETILHTFTQGAGEFIVPMYIDDDNALWAWNYAFFGTPYIWRFRSNGDSKKFNMGVTLTGLSDPGGMGFDDQGNAWVRGVSSTSVRVFGNFDESLATGTVTSLSTPYNAVSLMVDAGAIPGRMYCSSGTNTGLRGHGYYNTDTHGFTELYNHTGLHGTLGLVDPAGFIYIGSGPDVTRLEKFDLNGNLLASCLLHASNTAISSLVLDAAGGLWVRGLVSGASRAFHIDISTFTLVQTVSMGTSHRMIPKYDWNDNAIITWDPGDPTFEVFAIYNIPTVSSDATDLGIVVAAECALVGLAAGDVDVTDLTGTSLYGYMIAQRGPVRTAIEALMPLYLFDAVESDDKVKFVMRGGASAVSIPADDLGAYSGPTQSTDTLALTRKQESEIPSEITLTYYDRDANYQEGAQVSKRQTALGEEKLTVQVPVSLSAAEARQNADALMFMAQMSRTMAGFETSRAYAKYEPTDLVTISKNGRDYLVRITKRNDGLGGVIAWEGELEDSSVYTQSAPGASLPVPTGTIRYPGQTTLDFLDLPMLLISDNDPGLYTAAHGSSDDWLGMQLYKSTDAGATYQALADVTQLTESSVGRATGALPMFGTVETNELFDEVSTLTVVLDAGTLVSVTRNEVLDGANVAALKSGTGWEIIQFKTATLTGVDTYALSGFLRGRLGTEWAMAGHAAGDRFVVLSLNGLRDFSLGFSDINQAYHYKGVSVGNTLAGTNSVLATSTGVRVKPLAPWHLAGGRTETGDLLIKWVRRTRDPDVDWNIVSDPSLIETTEAYSIDIMSGATVVRTISATTATATYTGDQQQTDFGSPTPASVTVKVYQVSAEYGRGYPVTGTL